MVKKVINQPKSEGFCLHSVFIKKPISVKDATEIAQNIMRNKNRKFYKELKNGYRFRNIPKGKFKKGTFKTKKVNENINIVLGELLPEFHHLAGGGLWDNVKHGFNTVKGLFENNLHDFPGPSKKTLSQYENQPVLSMYLMRAPIQAGVNTALNVVSFGAWDKAKNYDKLFHLSLVAEIPNRKVIIEKLSTVNISTAFSQKPNAEILNIDMQGKQVTLGKLIYNTLDAIGQDDFFLYSGLNGRNCQNFIKNILKSNGLLRPEYDQWLFQDMTETKKKLPGYVSNIMDTVTTIGAKADRFFGGNEYEQIIGGKLHEIFGGDIGDVTEMVSGGPTNERTVIKRKWVEITPEEFESLKADPNNVRKVGAWRTEFTDPMGKYNTRHPTGPMRYFKALEITDNDKAEFQYELDNLENIKQRHIEDVENARLRNIKRRADKMSSTPLGSFLGGLTKIADIAVNNAPLPEALKMMYKNIAPAQSEYYKDNIINKINRDKRIEEHKAKYGGKFKKTKSN